MDDRAFDGQPVVGSQRSPLWRHCDAANTLPPISTLRRAGSRQPLRDSTDPRAFSCQPHAKARRRRNWFAGGAERGGVGPNHRARHGRSQGVFSSSSSAAQLPQIFRVIRAFARPISSPALRPPRAPSCRAPEVPPAIGRVAAGSRYARSCRAARGRQRFLRASRP